MGEQQSLFRKLGPTEPESRPVLVVEDPGDRVVLRLDGQPARRFGPGKVRRPRAGRVLSALLLVALAGCGGRVEDSPVGEHGAEAPACAGFGGSAEAPSRPPADDGWAGAGGVGPALQGWWHIRGDRGEGYVFRCVSCAAGATGLGGAP